MPWGRVDDTYYDHPKLDELRDRHEWPDRLAAAGLNALAWSWCNRYLTDGHVPRARVEKLGGSIELAEKLVAIGLWEEAAAGYQVHDFLVYNDSRAEVEERRRKEAERKAEYRKTKAVKARPAGSPNGTARSAATNVPPSVPAGQVDNGVEMSRKVSQRDTRAHARGRTPTPSRPTTTSEEKKASRSVATRAAGEPDRSVTMTAKQVEAWASFGPEWTEFRRAWVRRGLLYPPAGSATDDDTTQRGLLYQVLDAQPTNLVRWVAEAPAGSARSVIDYVLARWHDVRVEAGEDPEGWFALKETDRRAAPERLADIVARIGE